MPEYTFLNLSPPEFEELTRDLLQNEMSLTLESFSNSKDKGIDLRYAKSAKNELVVQCKRYSDFASLHKVLKKEVEKVQLLNPKRYLVSTSVSLSPQQKDVIQQMFDPFIESTGDIFGMQDLNNLLSIYPDIEKKHFKLWLSSTNILERILHSRIHNQSVFEEDKIQQIIRTYVENESYFESLEILREKRYLIISGMPGIGKTTLARILVYHFLANGFEEFVFLSDSINEGYDVFKEGKKQIFLFDDFLGRNFLERKLSTNEEQRIVRFIEKINTSNDKILILATREYILSQAKQRYDIFENPTLEFAKCIIDLSHYTKIVRAKILYNHLFFSEISEGHIDNILTNKSYEWIIQHRNYNPRIIETLTNPDIWKHIAANEFSEKIRSFLDYPESIWRHVYENQITKLSQCTLAILMSAGTPILYEDLKSAVQSFSKTNSAKYGISYSDIEFKKSIRELENTFVITNKDNFGQIAIDYKNPSVQDFLVNYLKDIPDFISDILLSAIYFNQLFKVFATEEFYLVGGKSIKRTNKIIVNEGIKQLLIDKLLRDYDFLNSSVILSNKYSTEIPNRWIKSNDSDYIRLSEISSELQLEKNETLRNFVVSTFGRRITPSNFNDDDFSYYLNLLKEFKNEYEFKRETIIQSYFSQIYFLQQLWDFEKFEEIFPEEYREFISSDFFYGRIIELTDEEAENASNENLKDTLEEIESISKKFKISCDDATELIESKMERNRKDEMNSYDWDKERYGSSVSFKGAEENETIANMFDSFREDHERFL